MRLSRRARRGIAIFNQLRTASPKRARYHSKLMQISVTPEYFGKNIISAALEAVNACVQATPDPESNSVPAQPEVGAQYVVPVQPEGSPATEEGASGGPK